MKFGVRERKPSSRCSKTHYNYNKPRTHVTTLMCKKRSIARHGKEDIVVMTYVLTYISTNFVGYVNH